MKKIVIAMVVSLAVLACGKSKSSNTTPTNKAGTDQKIEPAGGATYGGATYGGASKKPMMMKPAGGGGADPCGG
jgi:hypothetical protein